MFHNHSLRQKLGMAFFPLIIILCSLAGHTLYLNFQQATVIQNFFGFYLKLAGFITIAIMLLIWLRWILRDIVHTSDTFLERTLKIADEQWQQFSDTTDNKYEYQSLQALNTIQTRLQDYQRLTVELQRVFSALSNGDLTQTVNSNYFNKLHELKQDVNNTVLHLRQSIFDIKQAIDAAAQGVFDKRVSLENKQGLFKELAENLNQNLNLNQQLVEEVMRVFAAVSMGNLTQTITQNYSGSLLQLKIDVNDSVRKLNEIMNEISSVVDSSAQGSFDKRINLIGKEGFFRTISENLNRNLDVNQRIVEELMSVFSGMSQGNLQKCLVNEYSGRLSELKYDVNTSIKKLNEMMANIFQLTEAVDNGANEIAQGNLSLSQRTEEQAAALEETASSMQQMTDTVRQTAENAQQANQLSIQAKVSAERGGQVVSQAVKAMVEITKSSNQMSDIISVIDEIAFQTNLLALNAAVEAARAGEQGRGFAVVAIEVRNLAQRSAVAAKEIKQLIKNSLSKVDEGSQLVNQSGKALDEIVLNVKKVSDIIAEIAAAGQEQASGILQVNRAVTQLDETTQQNAAMVEEITASSDSTKEQVKQLRTLLNFFQFESSKQVATATDTAKRHAPALSPASIPAHVSRNSHPTIHGTTPHVKSIAAEVHKKLHSKERNDDDEWDEF